MALTILKKLPEHCHDPECKKPVIEVIRGVSSVTHVHEKGEKPSQVWGCTKAFKVGQQ